MITARANQRHYGNRGIKIPLMRYLRYRCGKSGMERVQCGGECCVDWLDSYELCRRGIRLRCLVPLYDWIVLPVGKKCGCYDRNGVYRTGFGGWRDGIYHKRQLSLRLACNPKRQSLGRSRNRQYCRNFYFPRITLCNTGTVSRRLSCADPVRMVADSQYSQSRSRQYWQLSE